MTFVYTLYSLGHWVIGSLGRWAKVDVYIPAYTFAYLYNYFSIQPRVFLFLFVKNKNMEQTKTDFFSSDSDLQNLVDEKKTNLKEESSQNLIQKKTTRDKNYKPSQKKESKSCRFRVKESVYLEIEKIVLCQKILGNSTSINEYVENIIKQHLLNNDKEIKIIKKKTAEYFHSKKG